MCLGTEAQKISQVVPDFLFEERQQQAPLVGTEYMDVELKQLLTTMEVARELEGFVKVVTIVFLGEVDL